MGKLFIVATPIGNLSDLTFRAMEVLKNVDLIACEDTRNSKKLLDHYQISTKTISYHQHSNSNKIKEIITLLKNGLNIALITDAGTPGISDPGNKLISELYQFLGNDLQVIPVPGVSALTAALSISGLPTDNFQFLGFLPHKKGRETIFKRIQDSSQTIIFYESTHRINKTLQRLAEIIPERKIVVCREMTKKFETVYRGTIAEVAELISDSISKGEFVIIINAK